MKIQVYELTKHGFLILLPIKKRRNLDTHRNGGARSLVGPTSESSISKRESLLPHQNPTRFTVLAGRRMKQATSA